MVCLAKLLYIDSVFNYWLFPLKKLILSLALLLFSSQSLALSGVTREGYVACKSIPWLNEMLDFQRRNDAVSIQAYLNSRKCITLNKGRRVAITEAPGIYGSKTGFTLNRVKYWTVREALDYD